MTTTNGSGLNKSVFSETFTSGVNNPTYTTEGYVDRTIRQYLNTNSTVNINIESGLCIFSTVTGSNLTTVTVGLSANLGDLDDVNLTGLATNEYLQWDGTCWVPGPGASISDLTLTNMSDISGGLVANAVLETNSAGTSALFVANEYVKVDDMNFSSNDGIEIVKNSTYPATAKFQTNFNNFTETFSGTSTDYFVTFDGTQTNKIQKKNIKVSQFSDFDSDVVDVMGNNLFAQNVTGSSGHASGLSVVGTTFYLNLEGYLTGAGGILPISQGGTSGNTSASARDNLGVSYSRDVMVYEDPLFRNVMVGESVRLVGGLSGTSIYTSGSGYDASNTHTIETPQGRNITISITTGSSGEILSASLTQPEDGFPYIYEDFIAEVNGGGGSGGSIQILADTSYINFGVSNGEEGVGFRYYEGRVEVRTETGSASDWEIVNNRFGVSELADVSAPVYPYTDGDVLIFNGTCFIPTQISGDITIDSSGDSTFTSGGLCLSQIYFGNDTPTTGDFQNIIGTCSNIQDQLDDKLYVGTPIASDRELIVLNNPTLGGVCTSTLAFDNTSPQSDHPQVPVILHTSPQGVSFMNVYETFGTSTYQQSDISDMSVAILHDRGSGDGIATGQELPDFIDLIHSQTGGLNVGGTNQLQLQIENLDDYATTNYNDYVAIGLSQPPVNSSNQKIYLKDLLKIPFYTEPSSAPTELQNTQGSLAFFTDYSGTSYLGIATGNGSSWYGVSGFTDIF
jgi:hypothetical protein